MNAPHLVIFRLILRTCSGETASQLLVGVKAVVKGFPIYIELVEGTSKEESAGIAVRTFLVACRFRLRAARNRY